MFRTVGKHFPFHFFLHSTFFHFLKHFFFVLYCRPIFHSFVISIVCLSSAVDVFGYYIFERMCIWVCPEVLQCLISLPNRIVKVVLGEIKVKKLVENVLKGKKISTRGTCIISLYTNFYFHFVRRFVWTNNINQCVYSWDGDTFDSNNSDTIEPMIVSTEFKGLFVRLVIQETLNHKNRNNTTHQMGIYLYF